MTLQLWGVALALVVTSIPATASAQSSRPSRIAVFVDHSGDDGVGTSFAYDLREQLRTSRGYRLVEIEPKAGIGIRMVSIDTSCDGEGNQSAIAISMTADLNGRSLFVTSWIYNVGRNRTQDTSKRLLADVDKQVAMIRRLPSP